uniref:Triosephosphate isomerase n=1 Tax=candidate division WWE3 bacterium TaxID=2053526 RepID=A0A7C4TQC6_UNCKA
MNKLVVGNWKQNKTLKETKEWITIFDALISKYIEDKGTAGLAVDIIVAPPFPFLPAFQDIRTRISNFYVASQDVSAFESGRHTGEVGTFQLKDFVEYSLVGHSERAEGRDLVMQKVDRLLEAAITPVMCFSEFKPELYKEGVVLVWEDPENISNEGGDRAKSIEEVAEGIKKLRVALPAKAKVLYGGSVNRQNAPLLSNIDGLDGVLPGNASLDPTYFFEIIKAFDK